MNAAEWIGNIGAIITCVILGLFMLIYTVFGAWYKTWLGRSIFTFKFLFFWATLYFLLRRFNVITRDDGYIFFAMIYVAAAIASAVLFYELLKETEFFPTCRRVLARMSGRKVK